jgi:hypothetical protein
MLTGRDMFHEHFPVLANSMPNTALLMMIRSGHAKPLPLEYSQVIDGVINWGDDINHQWRRWVVERLAEWIEGPAWKYNRDMVRSLISMRVQKMIEDIFGDSMTGDMLFVDWINWFDTTYNIEHFDGEFAFKDVATSSFDHVNGSIVAMNNSMNRVHADRVNSA